MPFDSFLFPRFEDQKIHFPKIFSPNVVYLVLEEISKTQSSTTPYIKTLLKYPRIPEIERKEVLMKILKISQDPKMNIISEKGIAESIFQQLLLKYFENSILWDKTINPSNISNPYVPDFIYFDPITNLKIDIEIDEPYVLASGEPIHFDYTEKPFRYDSKFISIDEHRNKYFQTRGWFVLRFCEEQIIRQGHECCNFLAHLIFYITGNDSYLDALNDYDNLHLRPLWPLEECIKLEKQSYREKYLGLPSRIKSYVPDKEISELLEPYTEKKESFKKGEDELLDLPF